MHGKCHASKYNIKTALSHSLDEQKHLVVWHIKVSVNNDPPHEWNRMLIDRRATNFFDPNLGLIATGSELTIRPLRCFGNIPSCNGLEILRLGNQIREAVQSYVCDSYRGDKNRYELDAFSEVNQKSRVNFLPALKRQPSLCTDEPDHLPEPHSERKISFKQFKGSSQFGTSGSESSLGRKRFLPSNRLACLVRELDGRRGRETALIQTEEMP